MGLLVFAGFDEVFHLHLFELARAKDEVAGCDFVAKALSNLSDTKWELSPRSRQDIEKVYEDSLCGLRPQVGQRRGIVLFRRSTDRGAKHQIESAWLCQVRRVAIRTVNLFRSYRLGN